jgi:hypothetical protein
MYARAIFQKDDLQLTMFLLALNKSWGNLCFKKKTSALIKQKTSLEKIPDPRDYGKGFTTTAKIKIKESIRTSKKSFNLYFHTDEHRQCYSQTQIELILLKKCDCHSIHS